MERNNGGHLTRDPKPSFENTENENRSEQNQELVPSFFDDQIDSNCSTPYVSATSSPGRGSGPVNGGFYYSAPASPMHFALTASYPVLSSSPDNSIGGGSVGGGFEFGFGSGAMSSADELFLDGMIRPMKLSTHLERPQVLAPLLDLEEQEEQEKYEEIRVSSTRGRDLRVVRDKSMRRRTRSLSPLRSTSLKWDDDEQRQHKSAASLDNIQHMEEKNESKNKTEKTTTTVEAEAASISASSSRSSSAGRSSKRWVFLKDFLYRSKSEGRSNNKFWSTISFSPVLHKEKKLTTGRSSSPNPSSTTPENNNPQKGKGNSASQLKKPVNGIGKRRVPPSLHELHYTTNKAQAEEMRKKTFLPYRQGLLACLGFSSKGYGAMNGLARALNPVSSSRIWGEVSELYECDRVACKHRAPCESEMVRLQRVADEAHLAVL